jgi:hypothetical protein
MKNLINFAMIVFFSISFRGYSQCNVQTSKGSNGATFKYLNSEIVGTGIGCDLGVSVSTNGTNFFFNTNVRYAKKPVKSGGTLIITLKNNQSLNLKLISCQITDGKKPEVVMSVYSLMQPDIDKLKKAEIENVVFQEVGGKNQDVRLSKNFDVALRHLKCLE